MKSVSVLLGVGLCLIAATQTPAWEAVHTGTVGLRTLQFIGADTGYVTGNIGTVLKTVDGGDHWAKQTAPLYEMLETAHFINGRTGWVISDVGDLYRTRDGGATWEFLSRSSPAFKSIFFQTATVGWALQVSADSLRILRTADGGASWSRVLHRSTGYGAEAVSTGEVRFSGNTGWVVVGLYLQFVNQTYGWSSGYTPVYGHIEQGWAFKTLDGGQTWTELPGATGTPWKRTASLGNRTWMMGAHSGTESTPPQPYACGHNGQCAHSHAPYFWNRISHTDDGGASWKIDTTATWSDRSQKAFDFLEGSGYLAGSSGLLMRSTNGGESWSPETFPTMESLYAIKIISPNKAIAVGEYGIFKTNPRIVPIKSAPGLKSHRTSLSGNIFRYTLPYATEVSIIVRDLRVASLWNHRAVESPGSRSLSLPLASLPPGNYFVEFQAGGLRESLRLTHAR